MEHTLAITAAALLLVAALVLCAFALTGSFADEPFADESQSSAFSGESDAAQMRLGVYCGYLALFVGAEETPAETYDVMVRTLPDADRARLVAGIPVANDAELKRLIEDFTS